MSQFSKRMIFVFVGMFAVGSIGILNPDVQRLLGLFAFGWMLSDISYAAFPETK